jgi:hypothetical protein
MDETKAGGWPFRCPVCHGKKLIPPAFYASSDWAGSSVDASEYCRSCDNTGIVWQEWPKAEGQEYAVVEKEGEE